MKNKKLVLAQIENCKIGYNGKDNHKKLIMEWLVKNPNANFKISDLADELAVHVPTLSKALHNLKLGGFKFKLVMPGPNRIVYRYVDFVPVEKPKVEKVVKIKKKATPDAWLKTMALMV